MTLEVQEITPPGTGDKNKGDERSQQRNHVLPISGAGFHVDLQTPQSTPWDEAHSCGEKLTGQPHFEFAFLPCLPRFSSSSIHNFLELHPSFQ